ncbi:MAG: hypothetical protein ACYC3F_01080 [Gemmatimonadaceae bacterium]
MPNPHLPYSQARAGPFPGPQGDAEHVVRERMRDTRTRPDGSVEQVVEAERLSVWRSAQTAALPGGSIAPHGWWEQFKDLLLFLAGAHVVLGTAVAAGFLVGAVGGNPVLGYAGVWVIFWLAFVRAK